MKAMAKAYDWSHLPGDLLADIFELLEASDLDRGRIGAVCTTWRNALMLLHSPNPTRDFPFKLPIVIKADIPDLRYRLLRQHTIYIISPESNTCTAFLMRVEEIEPKHWKLQNISLNCPTSLSNPCNVNLLDYHRIQAVANSYAFDVSNDPEDETISYNATRVDKIVTLKASSLTMIMYLEDNRIFFLVEAEKHIWATINEDLVFKDIISYKDEFLFVDRKGILFKLIINQSKPEGFINITQGLLFANNTDVRCMHLVESNGSLYLVAKTNPTSETPAIVPTSETESQVTDPTSENHATHIHVFVLEKQSQKWKRVNSLENKVFFLTNEVNFSFSPNDFGRKKGNSIYFLDCLSAKDDDTLCIELQFEGSQEESPEKHVLSFIPPPTWLTPDESLTRNKCPLLESLYMFWG